MPLSCAIFDDRLEVEDVALRVADALAVERLGVRADRGLPPGEVVGVDEAHLDAHLRERVVQLVVGAAVERRARHDVPAVLGEVQQRDRLRGLPARDGQRADATFERDHALLERVLGGVHDPRVDVAELGETEQRGRVIGVAEHERRRLVDRRDTCAGRVRLGAGVHLTGLETPVGHGCLLTIVRCRNAMDRNPTGQVGISGRASIPACDFRFSGRRSRRRRCGREPCATGDRPQHRRVRVRRPERPADLRAPRHARRAARASTGPTRRARARAARHRARPARASATRTRFRWRRSPTTRPRSQPSPTRSRSTGSSCSATPAAVRTRSRSPHGLARPRRVGDDRRRARARSARGRRGRTCRGATVSSRGSSLHAPVIARVVLRVADIGRARSRRRVALWSAEAEMSKPRPAGDARPGLHARRWRCSPRRSPAAPRARSTTTRCSRARGTCRSSEIRVPVHCWHGTADNARSARAHRGAASSGIPDARLTTWPGEGHLALITHVAEVLDDIARRARLRPEATAPRDSSKPARSAARGDDAAPRPRSR